VIARHTFQLLMTKWNSINSIEDFCKIGNVSYRKAKFLIMNDIHFKKLKELISEDEAKQLLSLNSISDISDVEILSIYVNDDEVNTYLAFTDQDGKDRFVVLVDDYFGPGVALYAFDSESAKSDLIIKINKQFKIVVEDLMGIDSPNDDENKTNNVVPFNKKKLN
jgi:hypothetical protein